MKKIGNRKLKIGNGKSDSQFPIFILCFMLIIPCAYAEQQLAGSEYQVKAGFIYNFVKFTEWPSDMLKENDDTIILCVASDNSEADAIFALNNKSVRNKKFMVKKINTEEGFQIPFLTDIKKKADKKGVRIPFLKSGDKTEENRKVVETCHILFLASENEEFVQNYLSLIQNKSILTIGETENFTQMCGVINFFNKDNRLHFEVNQNAARHAGLKFRTQLLQSATIVKKSCEDK